jgi:acyl-CoA synthetase (AMP-forming)/AMP-acid ligase II
MLTHTEEDTKMANVKTFTVAGVSTLNGIAKVRFSNDIEQRVAMLAYSGHVDITLVALATEGSKLEAAIQLQGMTEMQNEVQQSAIADYIEKNTPRPAAARGRPVKLPTLTDIPLRVNGKFAAKAVREQMLADLIADTLTAKANAAAKRQARAATKAAAEAEAELATA